MIGVDEKQDLLERALVALRVYKERGDLAVALLHEKGICEQFFILLRRRDAAFHNFLALDAKARSLGFDIATYPPAQLIWHSIGPINSRLADLIKTSRDVLASSLKKVEDGSIALKAYSAPKTGGERLRKQA